MWYQNTDSKFFHFVTKHACDGDGLTDGWNYDPQDHDSIAALCSNNNNIYIAPQSLKIQSCWWHQVNTVLIRSLKYAGVEEDIVLNVSDAILYVTRCLTGSQRSDPRSGLASVWPPPGCLRIWPNEIPWFIQVFLEPLNTLFHTIIKWKPDVTNHCSSHFGTYLAEWQNIFWRSMVTKIQL